MARKRGKLFIDSTVQGAIAKRILVHWCVFFLLAILSLITLEYFLGDPALSFRGHLSAILSKYAFFLLLMLAIVPSFVYDTLKLSNRFAGPVHRLKDSIRRLADGERVSELKFRENDFWCELSHDFNRVAERLNEPQAQA